MSIAQKTVSLYRELGVLEDCKKLSTIFNRDNGQWEIWGHFQNQDGRKNAKVASFDKVEDAVEFSRSAI